MSKYVSIEAFRTRREPQTVDVECPALGGMVRIVGPTAKTKTVFEVEKSRRGAAWFRPLLIVASVVEPEGLTIDDAKAMLDDDAMSLEPIVDAAMVLWGYSSRQETVEDAEKN